MLDAVKVKKFPVEIIKEEESDNMNQNKLYAKMGFAQNTAIGARPSRLETGFSIAVLSGLTVNGSY